jgi:NADPH:quinone reductase-like Zn-dependent oxidoreductase
MAPSDLPKTMRAAQFASARGGIESNIKVNVDAKLPKSADHLPADGTLVRVAYASINPIDHKLVELPIIGRLMMLGHSKIPGGDFSGFVVATGLSHLKAGDRVFGHASGTLAEFVTVSKSEICPCPAGVSLRDAATLPIAGLAALQGLRPFVKTGDTVLINGASGGVGSMGIQIAKALGTSVTATCSGANLDLCKSLGADEVFDYRQEGGIVKALQRAGHQYDHVFDTVFYNPALYFQAADYTKPQGLFATVGGNINWAFVKAIARIYCLPGFLGGGQRPFKYIIELSTPEDLAFLAHLVEEGKLIPAVQEELPLDKVAEAFANLKTHHTRGKIVIKVDGE